MGKATLRVLSAILGVALTLGGVAFFVWWLILQFDPDWMWRNGPLLIPAMFLCAGGGVLVKFGLQGNLDPAPPPETDIF